MEGWVRPIRRPEPTLPTSVNIKQLSDAVQWLENIQKFVETHCIGYMPEIAKQVNTADLDMEGVDQKLTGTATVFGAFYSGYGLQSKHDAAYQAVHTSLKDMAQHLGKAADATRKIAENYRTAEEQNRANARDIQRALDSGRYTPKDPNAIAGGQPDTGVKTAVQPPLEESDATGSASGGATTST